MRICWIRKPSIIRVPASATINTAFACIQKWIGENPDEEILLAKQGSTPASLSKVKFWFRYDLPDELRQLLLLCNDQSDMSAPNFDSWTLFLCFSSIPSHPIFLSF